MKNKKKVLAIAMAAAMALSLAACSNSGDDEEESYSSDTTTTYKVGIVNYVDDASLNQIISNCEAELDAKGEELGVKFDYEPYYDNAQADAGALTQIGADLVEDQVDIIIAVATPTASVMMSATEDKDIPIVFAAASDPVGAGLVDSLDAPGGMVTGTSDALDAEALINLMLAADPDIQSVGLLYDTAQAGSLSAIEQAKSILESKNIQYVEKTGSTTDDVLLAAQSLVDAKVDAVFTPTDNTIMAAEQAICDVFADAGIPHYTGADSFALWGAFVGYGVDYAVLGTATADLAVDILVNGADPATTPVVTFGNGIVSVNTDTCTKLGYNLDDIKTAFSGIATEFRELTTQQEFDN